MKKLKRSNVYKSANCEFNADELKAWSYDWWQFLTQVDGKLVFNSHAYSKTTSTHQSKVREVLRDLNISIDLFVKAPCGFQNPAWKAQTVTYEYQELAEAITKAKYGRNKEKPDTEQLHRVLSLLGQEFSSETLELRIKKEEEKRENRLLLAKRDRERLKTTPRTKVYGGKTPNRLLYLPVRDAV